MANALSETLIALAALAVGVLLGLFARRPWARPAPPVPRTATPLERSNHRELLNAADDLEYALNTVRTSAR